MQYAISSASKPPNALQNFAAPNICKDNIHDLIPKWKEAFRARLNQSFFRSASHLALGPSYQVEQGAGALIPDSCAI